MRRASLLCLALLVPASAHATAFRDEATGLNLYITVPGAVVCFLRPGSMREDTADCSGLDLAAAQKLQPSVSLFAVVRFQDWSFAINGTGFPKLKGPISRADARDFLKGWAVKGLTTQEPECLVVNGLEVLRFVSVTSSTTPPNAILSHLMAGKNGLMILSFLTDNAHLARVRVIAQGVIASVNMPHTEAPASWTNPVSETAGYRMGVLAVQLAFDLAVLAAICASAVFLYRRLRSRKSTS
jgi:hypothetical protein